MNTPKNIEIINLERGERYAGADAPAEPYVKAHGLGLCVYAPWDHAEPECKRRCLEALAARVQPPDGVAFVRTWEAKPPVVEPIQNVGTSPQVYADCNGVTVSGSFGPAAEMAAAARVAAGGPAEPKPRGRRASRPIG